MPDSYSTSRQPRRLSITRTVWPRGSVPTTALRLEASRRTLTPLTTRQRWPNGAVATLVSTLAGTVAGAALTADLGSGGIILSEPGGTGSILATWRSPGAPSALSTTMPSMAGTMLVARNAIHAQTKKAPVAVAAVQRKAGPMIGFTTLTVCYRPAQRRRGRAPAVSSGN